MGYYHLKNLNVDKKNGNITGEFADSNIFPEIYCKSEIKGKTFHEKYSNLIYDIIAGNYHPTRSSKYYVLCNAWTEAPLKNFTNDCSILGVERAYDKYRKVINDLINHRKPEVIKSEIDLHYEIDYGENKNYENLSQKVRDISNFMQDIRNNKKISHIDRLVMLKEFQEKIGISFPLVTIKGIEHSTKMYLNFNITSDDYTSYRITVENTETGDFKSYENKNMNITWITDCCESEMAYKMQNYEKKFLVYEKCKEFLNNSIFKNHSQNDIVKLEKLDLQDNEIRIFLDLIYEFDSSLNFKYDNISKEITFNPTVEKEVDIVDEMFG